MRVCESRLESKLLETRLASVNQSGAMANCVRPEVLAPFFRHMKSGRLRPLSLEHLSSKETAWCRCGGRIVHEARPGQVVNSCSKLRYRSKSSEKVLLQRLHDIKIAIVSLVDNAWHFKGGIMKHHAA